MRYKCTVSYDGSSFHGFQVQNDLRTVQLEIEQVLHIITKTDTRIHPSGRTDAGVHALGQVFHFDTEVKMQEWQMKNAINSRLPRDIYIKKVEIVSEYFHSRYDSVEKTYMYLIDLGEYNPLLEKYRYFMKRKIDIDAFKNAAQSFVGTIDFKAFTKNHKITNTVRTISSIDVDVEGSLVKVTFKGNGFLHNMVRIIIAMLIEVAEGKKTKEDLKWILENKDRKLAPKTAPPNGLYLMEVAYKKD